jgi:leucyl-tRNA synthetase
MDTFVDSSWYFYRFCDPKNEAAPFESAKAPVVFNQPVHWRCDARDSARSTPLDARDAGHRTPATARICSRGQVQLGGKTMSKYAGTS